MNALNTIILIADDEMAVSIMVERILASMGLSAVIVPDGTQAVQVAQTMPDKLSCAILDIMMPGTNGVDAAETIRQFLPNLPIILMSGNFLSDLTQRVNTLSHSAFLQKPFTVPELKSALEQVLQTSEPNLQQGKSIESWQYDALGRWWRLQIDPWIATVERWPGSLEYEARLETKQLSVVIRGPHVFASLDEAQAWCIKTIAEQRN